MARSPLPWLQAMSTTPVTNTPAITKQNIMRATVMALPMVMHTAMSRIPSQLRNWIMLVTAMRRITTWSGVSVRYAKSRLWRPLKRGLRWLACLRRVLRLALIRLNSRARLRAHPSAFALPRSRSDFSKKSTMA